MSISKLLRGSLWLYLTNIVNNIAGFFYWLVISAIAGSKVLGVTSAIVSLATLVSGILSLGIGMGSMRFYGKALGTQDKQALTEYFWSSFIFTLIIFTASGIILHQIALLGVRICNMSIDQLKLASLYMVILGLIIAPQSLVTSMLKTNIRFLAALVGNILRFGLGVYLVLKGWEWVGATLGYITLSIVVLLTNTVYAIKTVGFHITFSLKALKDLIRAGIASWLPNIITLMGQWLGVLSVFGTTGAIETGHYFVAFSISSIIATISSNMLTLLFPVLSGMQDGRKRVADRIINISFAITLPLTIFVMLYPWLPLSLLGKEYTLASQTLFVLLISNIPAIITSGINFLIYAYGYYNKVLFLGLSSNIPRVVLYALLTPKLGGLGAAISYTLGSFLGIFYAIIIAKQINFKINWVNIGRSVIIPTIMGVLLWFLNVPWYLGLILIPASLLIYLKLRVLTKNDIREIAKALWLEPIVEKIYDKYRGFFDLFLS